MDFWSNPLPRTQVLMKYLCVYVGEKSGRPMGILSYNIEHVFSLLYRWGSLVGGIFVPRSVNINTVSGMPD